MSRGFKQSEVLDALKGSAGIMSTVASRLQCDWSTAQTYVNKWAATRQAIEDERNIIADMAEGVLYKSIKGGDTQDAKWYLSRVRKGRFSERQEVAMTYEDLTKLTDEELQSIIES